LDYRPTVKQLLLAMFKFYFTKGGLFLFVSQNGSKMVLVGPLDIAEEFGV
jgi:hypothetical protein